MADEKEYELDLDANDGLDEISYGDDDVTGEEEDEWDRDGKGRGRSGAESARVESPSRREQTRVVIPEAYLEVDEPSSSAPHSSSSHQQRRDRSRNDRKQGGSRGRQGHGGAGTMQQLPPPFAPRPGTMPMASGMTMPGMPASAMLGYGVQGMTGFVPGQGGIGLMPAMGMAGMPGMPGMAGMPGMGIPAMMGMGHMHMPGMGLMPGMYAPGTGPAPGMVLPPPPPMPPTSQPGPGPRSLSPSLPGQPPSIRPSLDARSSALPSPAQGSSSRPRDPPSRAAYVPTGPGQGEGVEQGWAPQARPPPAPEPPEPSPEEEARRKRQRLAEIVAQREEQDAKNRLLAEDRKKAIEASNESWKEAQRAKEKAMVSKMELLRRAIAAREAKLKGKGKDGEPAAGTGKETSAGDRAESARGLGAAGGAEPVERTEAAGEPESARGPKAAEDPALDSGEPGENEGAPHFSPKDSKTTVAFSASTLGEDSQPVQNGSARAAALKSEALGWEAQELGAARSLAEATGSVEQAVPADAAP